MTTGKPLDPSRRSWRRITPGAVVVAVAALLAAFWLLGGHRSAPPAADQRPDVAPPVPVAGPLVPPPPPPDVTAEPVVAPPPAPEWSKVALAARPSDLGPALARSVYDGLQRARAALQPCFDEDERDAAARPRAPEQEDAWGAAILTLQLEGRNGELVVTGAPLQSLGTSSMLLAGCAERTLRGFRFPAPGAVPGQRYRIQYQLVQ